MPLSSKLKSLNRITLASVVFYAVTGVMLLVFLPLTGYPPHLGFLGILSLITAFSLLMKRGWAPYLVFIVFVANTAFTLYTLYSVGFSNPLVALSMIVYAVLTWATTFGLLLKR